MEGSVSYSVLLLLWTGFVNH